MAKFREIACMYYVSFGDCKKGRDACHKGYCQKCNKYYPRAKLKCQNQKKSKLEQIRKRELD